MSYASVSIYQNVAQFERKNVQDLELQHKIGSYDTVWHVTQILMSVVTISLLEFDASI